jgi:hypothetical protein
LWMLYCVSILEQGCSQLQYSQSIVLGWESPSCKWGQYRKRLSDLCCNELESYFNNIELKGMRNAHGLPLLRWCLRPWLICSLTSPFQFFSTLFGTLTKCLTSHVRLKWWLRTKQTTKNKEFNASGD